MKRALIGAGGFAREVKSYMGDPKLPMFVDDEYFTPNKGYIFPLSKFDPKEYCVVVAIGDPRDRWDMVQKLPKETKYFKYIHPSVQPLNGDVFVGEGSIICPGTIITVNVNIGKHCHLNLLTTVGHDVVIGDYFTSAPGAKVSGNVTIYDCVYMGTNASIREKLSIHSFVTIGSNAAVVKNIESSGTFVGVPVKQIR